MFRGKSVMEVKIESAVSLQRWPLETGKQLNSSFSKHISHSQVIFN